MMWVKEVANGLDDGREERVEMQAVGEHHAGLIIMAEQGNGRLKFQNICQVLSTQI
jgi:hypothetical protein